MKNIILPLDDDLVWKLLQHPDQKTIFDIDIARSINNLHDKLLIYVSNLNLDVRFDSSVLTVDQKEFLFDQYMNLNRVYSCDVLDHTLLHVVCVSRGIQCKSFSMFDDQQAQKYIETHKQIVDNVNTFVDSSLLYIAYQMQLNQLIDQQPLDEIYDVIDDASFVPQVAVNLFKFEQSIVLLSKTDEANIKYLKKQFENAMFSGEYLNSYLINQNNYFAAFFNDIVTRVEK